MDFTDARNRRLYPQKGVNNNLGLTDTSCFLSLTQLTYG